jgi:hypothetical protein
VLLDELESTFESDSSLEIAHYFPVSYRHETRSRWTIYTHIVSYFVYESRVKHFFYSLIDPRIEEYTISVIGCEIEYRESRSTSIIGLTLGSASLTDHLESTYHVAVVVQIEIPRVSWIEMDEHVIECLIAISDPDLFELSSISPVWY